MKLFVTDLDGTLLDHDKRVRPEDRKGIERLQEAGWELCFASGRHDADIAHITGWFGGNIHRVANNGAIVRAKDNTLIRSAIFPLDVAAGIYEKLSTIPGIIFTVSDREGDVFVNQRTSSTKPYENRLFVNMLECSDMARAFGHTLFPGKFSVFGGMERLEQIAADITSHFGSAVETFKADHDCVDLMPLGITKGSGLDKLLAHLKVTPFEMACAGDSHNDISMLEMTPLSFAMEHSHPDVKRAAVHSIQSVAEAADLLLA